MERPILFSTPMVQAILDGRKTQTRRIIKKQPVRDEDSGYKYWDDLMFDIHDDVLETMYMPDHCPYGKVGDILWVRESFTIIGTDIIRDSGSEAIIDELPQYVFRGQKQPHIEKLLKWKPSIFMPKNACRIRLEVTNIRVERLEDISYRDAVAEGIKYSDSPIGFCGYDYLSGGYNVMTTPWHCYLSLWRSINKIERYGDTGNPWVWVIEFKVKEVRK